MCKRFIVTLAVLCLGVIPSHGDEKKGKPQVEDLVYQGIADLSFVRDDVLKRYALMVTGESHRMYSEKVKRPPLTIDRIYKLQAQCKTKDFLYRATGKMMGPESSNRNYDFQFWGEFWTCGNITKGRVGAANRKGYKIREKGQTTQHFIDANRLTRAAFDPFDDLVIHPMFMRGNLEQYGWIENVYLRESVLLKAERITQGDIRSKWRWKQHSLQCEVEMIQSKAYAYMPTQVKFVSKIKSDPKLYGETHIKWKKHLPSGNFLPHIVKTKHIGSYGLSEDHHHWVFDWRIGKELNEDFFDCGAKDFRSQFTPLYDFEFDTYDQSGGPIVGTPWKLPDELLEADAAK